MRPYRCRSTFAVRRSRQRQIVRLAQVALRRPARMCRLSVVLSTKGGLERETGLEPATFSLEG